MFSHLSSRALGRAFLLIAMYATIHPVEAQSTVTPLYAFGAGNGLGQGVDPPVITPAGVVASVRCCGPAGTLGPGGSVFKLDADGFNPVLLLRYGDLGNATPTPFGRMVGGSDGGVYGLVQNVGAVPQPALIKVRTDGLGYEVIPGVTGIIRELMEGAEGRLYFVGQTGLRAINKDGSGGQNYPASAVGEAGVSRLFPGTQTHIFGVEQLTSGRFQLNRIATDGTGWSPVVTLELRRNFAQVIASSDGFLYGTTTGEVVSPTEVLAAQIFRVRPDGTDFAVLHAFDAVRHPTDTQIAYGTRAFLMEGSDGRFYGSIETGGHTHPGYAFRIARDGSGYEKLFDFPTSYLAFDSGAAGGGGLNRSGPKPFVESAPGRFVGTTSGGIGLTSGGIVFAFDRDGSAFATTFVFLEPEAGGLGPSGPMVAAADGFLYGTSVEGGDSNLGTIWRVRRDGSGFELLKALPPGPSLNQPEGSSPRGLIAASDGKLYGAAALGGTTSNLGTVFRLNRDGSGFEVLRIFQPTGGDCRNPQAPPIEASDGKLYGTAKFGGGSAVGAIYRMEKDGTTYEVIHRFTGPANGANPSDALLEGADGRLYGTTEGGGPGGGGVVFAVNKNGSSYTTLQSFTSSGTGPRTPKCALVQGSDGTLFGTTSAGGSDGFGAIFSVKPDGSGFLTLRSFSGSNGDGRVPWSGLTYGADGKLYGTTQFGGGAVNGSVYRINSDGSGYEKLHGFGTAPGDGANPLAALTATPEGTLAGSTNTNPGTLFLVHSGQPPPRPLSLQLLPGGAARLELAEPAGQAFRIEVSSSLGNWAPLQSGRIPTTFIDTAAAGERVRFYRSFIGQ